MKSLQRLALLLLAFYPSTACTPPPSPQCLDGVCGCTEGDACKLVCNAPRCDVSCAHVGSCAMSCGRNCRLQCQDTSSCDLEAGLDAEVTCRRVSTCRATVGAGSHVLCEDLSNCDVTVVSASAEVRCNRVGSCTVSCLGGGAAQDCGNARFSCGSC